MSFFTKYIMKIKISSFGVCFLILNLIVTSVFAKDLITNSMPIDNPSSELFFTPDTQGHIKIINAFNKAQKEIKMMLFHLTDPEVVKALISAHQRGVQIKIILDSKFLFVPKYSKPYHQLLDEGIDVVKSSKAFSVSHYKSFVIDDQTAFITSMNLTDGPTFTRDYGFITNDQTVIQGLLDIFEMDLKNANLNEAETPNIANPDLVVSPTNATQKLVDLIGSAEHDIISTVENIDDADIMEAFKRAASRHIQIRLLTPLCSEARIFPKANMKRLKELSDAGVETKVMAGKGSVQQPYIHGKMLVVDAKNGYLGSENFSANSLKKSREIGIIVHLKNLLDKIKPNFESDWNAALSVNDKLPACN